MNLAAAIAQTVNPPGVMGGGMMPRRKRSALMPLPGVMGARFAGAGTPTLTSRQAPPGVMGAQGFSRFGTPGLASTPGYDPSKIDPLLKPGNYYGGTPTISGAPAVAQADTSAPNIGIPSELESDPILQQIKAAAFRALQQEKSATLADREHALVGFGDPTLAEKYLGKSYAGMGAVTSDPDKGFSTLSQINKSYRDTVNSTEEDLNKNNLFYGGFRGKTLNDLSYAKQKAVSQATDDVQQLLAGLSRQDLAAQAGYENTLLGGLDAAYARMLARQPPAGPAPPAPPAPDQQTQPGGSWWSGNNDYGSYENGRYYPLLRRRTLGHNVYL